MRDRARVELYRYKQAHKGGRGVRGGGGGDGGGELVQRALSLPFLRRQISTYCYNSATPMVSAIQRWDQGTMVTTSQLPTAGDRVS